MSQFRFQCPSCAQTLAAEETSRGEATRCPYCRSGIRIPVGASAPAPAMAYPASGQTVQPRPQQPQGAAWGPGAGGSNGYGAAPGAGGAPADNGQAMFKGFAGHVSNLAGLERPEGFSLSEFLSLVFKKHTEEEMEAYFTVGTPATTPSLLHVDTGWPKPWAFSRAFGFSLLLYFGLVVTLNNYPNVNLLPGLLLTGSFAVPLSMVIFFWEANAVRNVSLYQVIKLFFMGGVLSIFGSLFLFENMPLHNIFGAPGAGPIEETGKLMAVIFVARHGQYPYTLNGLLLGASVGAGFAAFESAGYALNQLVNTQVFSLNVEGMITMINVRGLLAPAGHIVWTAMAAAALWRVKRNAPFQFGMLMDWRFLRVFAIAVGLHMAWNTNFDLPLMGKYALVAAVGWVVVVSLIHTGLIELREEQRQVRGAVMTVVNH